MIRLNLLTLAHHILSLSMAIIALPLAAQQKPPPKLEPLPEPPPAIGFDQDARPERGVQVTPGAAERVEESVIDGKRVIHVINPNGTEYFLTEDQGDGTFARQNTGDTGLRPPRWLIWQF